MRVVIIGEHRLYETQVKNELLHIGVSANEILSIANIEQSNIDIATNFQPEIIIINYNYALNEMPKIFSISNTSHILYLSSKVDNEMVEKLMDMGVEKVLYKPFQLSSLNMYFNSIVEGKMNKQDQMTISLTSNLYEEENKNIGMNEQGEIEAKGIIHFQLEEVTATNEYDRNVDNDNSCSEDDFIIEDEEIPKRDTNSSKITPQSNKNSFYLQQDNDSGVEDLSQQKQNINEEEELVFTLNTSTDYKCNEASEIDDNVQKCEVAGEQYQYIETPTYIKPPINSYEMKEHYPNAVDEDASIYSGLYDKYKEESFKKGKISKIKVLVKKYLTKKWRTKHEK